jgi:hypothetical protein
MGSTLLFWINEKWTCQLLNVHVINEQLSVADLISTHSCIQKRPGTWTDSLGKRPKQKKIDMRFCKSILER